MTFPGLKEGELNKKDTLKPALKFTKKEVDKLPDELKKFITVELVVPVRQKKNGIYEARFRRGQINISAACMDYSKLKGKFLEKLLAYKPQVDVNENAPMPVQQQEAMPAFSVVCEEWLELKRPEIKAVTFGYYVQLFEANILPEFYGRTIDEVKQSHIMRVINKYVEQGKYRTATKIYQTLNAVFEYAVGEELLERSPMRKLKAPKYEENNGSAFSLAEEREFLELLQASKCVPEIKAALLLLLYTGARRAELAHMRIEGDFVSVICAKTRKGFQERRRLIPITPMLARWLPGINLEEACSVRPDALTQALKRLMPNHHLHELRHTFITRCQECGVAREVVSVWAGHAADNTQTTNVYTHFSVEFMRNEGQKVKYNL